MALKVTQWAMVVVAEERRVVATLMSIIINIDDFCGRDQIGSNTAAMQIKVLFCSLVHSLQNIDERIFLLLCERKFYCKRRINTYFCIFVLEYR
jgi:hypothetical protein